MIVYFRDVGGIVRVRVDYHGIDFVDGEAFFSAGDDCQYRVRAENIVAIKEAKYHFPEGRKRGINAKDETGQTEISAD